MNDKSIAQAYRSAKKRYAEWGIDTDKAMRILAGIPISLQCWQGDDVAGFESLGDGLSGGGILATGNSPGRARSPDELRSDLKTALSLIPGRHRVSIHASYCETGGRHVDRDALEPRHFAGWMDWAAENRLGLDFNATCFAHPMANDGFTLSHPDSHVRQFWIDHCRIARRIGAGLGRRLGTPCVTNIWVPDGFKDLPADRKSPRERMRDSLDEIFSEMLSPRQNLDALESKLFGIGSESYVVGSLEFCIGYAVANEKLLTLDMGHFHPTEVVSDKLSAVLTFVPEVLLHVSRGVRWDSDHVVLLSDELVELAKEIVRGGYLGRVHIGLDFFDASINRVAAWVIGTRSMIKALLFALLEPSATLREAEASRDYTTRLALLEEAKTMPFGAVWDYYCLKQGTPSGSDWLGKVRVYEKRVLSRRK